MEAGVPPSVPTELFRPVIFEAVTLPICAVPAPRVTEPDTAGMELTVTVVDASETGCVA